MTANENSARRKPIETALNALEARDAAAAASAYAEDAVFVDPRFPEAEYRGRERIREAFEWGLTNVAAQPEFTVRHYLATEDVCALEVDTRHLAREGDAVTFPQVFIVELGADGITHWRTYLPFSTDENCHSRTDHSVTP